MGLKGFGSFSNGMSQYCQQANSAMTYLPPEEAAHILRNMETMHNVYNPLSEYLLGLSVGSAITGIAGMTFGVATVAEKGSACIKDMAESMISEGEKDPKNLALTCGKSFINEGGSSFQGKASNYLIDILSSYKQKQWPKKIINGSHLAIGFTNQDYDLP